MDRTREKRRTFEEIRDSYVYLIFRIHERYKLSEDDLAELAIYYCEVIQRNLDRDVPRWAGRLQQALTYKAERILGCKKRRPALDAISLEATRGTYDEYIAEEVAFREAEIFELSHCLTKVLSTLTPREKCVLKIRFQEEKTLKECGALFGRSRERMRQIEARAIQKLRQPSCFNLLRVSSHSIKRVAHR